METYKIEVNKKELQCMIAALNIYKSELFDCLMETRNESLWKARNKRIKEVKLLLQTLEIINDPPF